jgi:hypothetical protein
VVDDLHEAVTCDSVGQELGLVEQLAAERLDRIAPELRDLHGSDNAARGAAIPA